MLFLLLVPVSGLGGTSDLPLTRLLFVPLDLGMALLQGLVLGTDLGYLGLDHGLSVVGVAHSAVGRIHGSHTHRGRTKRNLTKEN